VPWQEVRRKGKGGGLRGVPGGSRAGSLREARPAEREEELRESERAAGMCGWAAIEVGSESDGRLDAGDSGVEVVGQRLVEFEVRDGIGLGGIEGGGLIDDPRYAWVPRAREGRPSGFGQGRRERGRARGTRRVRRHPLRARATRTRADRMPRRGAAIWRWGPGRRGSGVGGRAGGGTNFASTRGARGV